jgi:hypothetical protein
LTHLSLCDCFPITFIALNFSLSKINIATAIFFQLVLASLYIYTVCVFVFKMVFLQKIFICILIFDHLW